MVDFECEMEMEMEMENIYDQGPGIVIDETNGLVWISHKVIAKVWLIRTQNRQEG